MPFLLMDHRVLTNELTEIVSEDTIVSAQWREIGSEVSLLVESWTEYGDGKEAAYPILTLFEWILKNENAIPYQYLLDVAGVSDSNYSPESDPCHNVHGHHILSAYGKWLVTHKIDGFGEIPGPDSVNSHGFPRADVYDFKSLCLFEAYECLSLSLKLKLVSPSAHALNKSKISFQDFIKEAKSSLAKNAANARHHEDREMKAQALAWYAENRNKFSSKDAAAEEIIKLVPVKFRTARAWLINQ